MRGIKSVRPACCCYCAGFFLRVSLSASCIPQLVLPISLVFFFFQILFPLLLCSSVPHAFLVDAQKKIVFEGHPADQKLEAAVEKCVNVGGGAESEAGAAKPTAPPPRKVQKETSLPRITETKEELMAKPVKALVKILDERSISREGVPLL